MKKVNQINSNSPTNHIEPPRLNIDAELIKTLYQQGHTPLIGVLATSTGIAAIFFNEVANLTVAVWLLSIYLLSFIRYLSMKKFKSEEREADDIIHWGWVFAFYTFLSGLTWGAASIIFFTPDNLQLFSILTLIILAMSVGSLAALSSFPKAYYLYVIPAMIPMIWRYLNIDEPNYIFFGLLLFVFNFALFSIVRVNRKILYDSIVLRFKNTDLIDQLTIEKDKAEQASVAKTKFLAAANHDIRQPLHAMGLFLDVLEDRVEKESQKNIVQKIQKSSNALNGLLDSLLDISKLDAGIIEVDNKPFCLNNLLESLQEEFTPYADEAELRLSFVTTQQWVQSDYRLIERIMRNLIGNALRYTDKGGVVVGCRRQQGEVLLAVYDSGIGIHQDNLEDIFSEFHQLDNPERDRSKGLGLGLAIVQRMTHLLGARLVIKSTPGRGSLFGIVLPTAPTPQQQTVAPPITDMPFFDGRCVLVIDDEEAIRDSLAQLLESWHCEVVACASNDEAVSMLQSSAMQPDLMLVDYRLRNSETGITAIEKINAAHSQAAIPAIIITGDTAPERIKETQNSGYKILHKPVLPSELRSSMAEILGS